MSVLGKLFQEGPDFIKSIITDNKWSFLAVVIIVVLIIVIRWIQALEHSGTDIVVYRAP